MKKFKHVLSVLLIVLLLFNTVSITVSSMSLNEFNSKLSSFRSTKYPNNSTYVDNPSLTGGYQCFGFANELALWIFGSYPTKSMSATNINSNWTRVYGGEGVDSLSIGDIVRYESHSIFITGISGSTVYYAHANSPAGTNRVSYDNTMAKSTLRNKVNSLLTHDGATKKGWVAHCKENVEDNSVTVTFNGNGGTPTTSSELSQSAKNTAILFRRR